MEALVQRYLVFYLLQHPKHTDTQCVGPTKNQYPRKFMKILKYNYVKQNTFKLTYTMVIRNNFRFPGLEISLGYVNELLGDQDRFPHDGHYRFVRGLDKRNYNDLDQNRRPRFGKRKLHVGNSPLSISDTNVIEKPVQLFKSWPRMVKSKRAVNWYPPDMIHKKWRPMMSRKLPSSKNKQNLNTSEHEERSNILQLPRQSRNVLPSIIRKQNGRRRRAQAFTRYEKNFIISYIYC